MNIHKEALIEIQNILKDVLTLEPQVKTSDKYGFYEVDENGLREVEDLNILLDDWEINGNLLQQRLSKEIPRGVLINYNLKANQIDPNFRALNDKFFPQHSMKIKAYDSPFQATRPKAAHIIFETITTGGKKYLVATGGNFSFKETTKPKYYERYLNAVKASCVRYCIELYKLEFTNGRKR